MQNGRNSAANEYIRKFNSNQIRVGTNKILQIEQYRLTFILLAMSFGVPRSAFGMVALLAMDSTDSDYLRVRSSTMYASDDIYFGGCCIGCKVYR